MDHESRQANGVSKFDSDQASKIVRALELVYDGRTSNQDRQAATNYLEQAKDERVAPSFGFQIAQDQTRPPIVRHYGLLCIENHVKYQWDSFQDDYGSGSDMAVSLARSLSDHDPLFLRNKIAYLWSTLAERGWPHSWQNFDENLYELWKSHSVAQREVVLHVLETLSDEVFSKEDSTAAVRGVELGKYCVGIFTSSDVLESVFGPRKAGSEVRYGTEGWFSRLLEALRHNLQQNPDNQKSNMGFSLKIISLLRSVMPWMVFKSISDSDCVELLCRCLMTPHPPLHMAAVEAMHALFHRQTTAEDRIETAAYPLLTGEGVSLLRNFYQSLRVTVDDLDDSKYTTLKKFSEVVCAIGMYLANEKSLVQAPSTDLVGFLSLLVSMLQSPSLVVSVPIVYLWTKFLSSEHITHSSSIPPLIGTLLELCSNRLIKYEVLPSHSNDDTLQFLNEDFETLPEKHAFLGNYRRFCSGVIERIVRKEPSDAMFYILSQSDDLIQSVYHEEQKHFDEKAFSTDTLASLRVDAQCSVISTALKSFMHTILDEEERKLELQDAWKPMHNKLRDWCNGVLQCNIRNPVIQKRLLSIVVEISLSALSQDSRIAVDICKTVLASIVPKVSESPAYDDALKELQFTRPRELQKLATNFANQLLPFYDDLEAEVAKLAQREFIDSKVTMDYQAFLFTIVLHSSTINDGSRGDKLLSMIEPILQSWKGPIVDRALVDFPSFCDVLSLDEFPQIFLSCKADEADDWSSIQLDENTNAVKEKIRNATDSLPLLATKSLLSISTERLPKESPVYKFSKSQWKTAMPTILTRMLPLVSHAHAFSNPDNWSNYPPRMRVIINRIIQDRVWQNGISNESRDDFYARVRKSKGTLEGFASTIRASLRTVRELSMFILHYFSSFGEDFYGIKELPEPLSEALYADAYHLSAHQANSLLKLSSTIVDRCPPENRRQFLAPVLISLFKQFDSKISAEWDIVEQRKATNANSEDDLDSEMKAESVLRNLTHSTVLEVSNLLGVTQKAPHKADGIPQPSHRTIILQSTSILEPIIIFCTHAIRVRDTRSCSLIARCLRDILPEFAESSHERNSTDGPQYLSSVASKTTTVDSATAAQVREYFASDVLKACITSLNDPYFSESSVQKEIAALIAGILVLYARSTSTAREVLLSLPGMTQQNIDVALDGMWKAKIERVQRSWVLRLLEGVRGVSIHESGKIASGTSKPRTLGVPTGTIRDQYMVVDDNTGAIEASSTQAPRQPSPDLGGVADLFG